MPDRSPGLEPMVGGVVGDGGAERDADGDAEEWAAGPVLPHPGAAPMADPDTGPAHRARALAAAEALVSRSPRALALIDRMLSDLVARAAVEDAPGAIFDLDGIGDTGVTLLDQVLGRGEVSGSVREPDGCLVSVQESVLTGVWRLHRRAPDGATRTRWIELGPVPDVVTRAAASGRPASTLDPGAVPPGTMAAAPLLAEIVDQARARRAGQPNHVLALTHLPVTRADLACLRTMLGPGPVALRSRGYGTCDIDATGIAGVWSVRFLNASDTVILDTLEVGDVPAAVRAAPQDFADAAVRLSDIRDAYL